MIQPELNYGRFRRLFVKIRRATPPNRVQPPEPEYEPSSEDEIERERVRRVQVIARSHQRILRELKKLEENPTRRYDHWTRGATFFIVVFTIVFAAVEFGHRMIFFETYPSDPLDVLRDVTCDVGGCTVRTYFDVEPPSMKRLAMLILTGFLGFVGCVRHLVGVHAVTLITTGVGSLCMSLLWISWRAHVYATARNSL